MSSYSPQCENVRAFVSRLYEGRSEPLNTVLDLAGSHPETVQINVQTEANEIQSLTLVALPSDGALPLQVRKVVSDFMMNPVTSAYRHIVV